MDIGTLITILNGSAISSWLPSADGVLASNFADYRTEGGANRYYNNGLLLSNAAAWWASRGTGSTFARASSKNVPAVVTGILTAFGTNAAAYTADPGTLKNLGRSYEGARTNLQIQSSDLTNATVWLPTGLQTIASGGTSPSGGSAFAITENTSTSSHDFIPVNGQGASITLGQTYSNSYFIQAHGRTRIRFFGGVAFNNVIGFFDTATGLWDNKSGGTTAVYTSQQYPNGWWKICVTDTATGVQARNDVSLVSSGTTVSYTGDGVSGIYAFGPVVELASFPSSYIATTTGSVTRSADSQSLTRTAPTSITKVIAGRTGVSSSVQQAAWTISNGSTIGTLVWNTNGTIGIAGSISLNSGVTVAANTDFVAAITMTGSAISISVNGSSVVSSAQAIPSSATTEIEGNYVGGALPWYSTIKGTTEWTNFAASNAALQALSGSSYWN